MNRLLAVRPDDEHLAGLDVANPLRVDQIQRARLRTHDVAVAQLAERQRPEAVRIAHRNQAILGQQHQRKRALRLRHGLDQRRLRRRRLRPRVQMQQHLGVARRLEDRSFAHEHLAQFLRVDQIAVVADGDFAVGAVDQNRLRVLDAAVAGRRIAHVADGAHAGEPVDRRFVEVVGDVAEGLVDLQSAAVRGRDADGFLAAMLQRVQPEIGQVGGLGVAVDAEDAALFFESHSHFYRSRSIDLLPLRRAPASQSARLDAHRVSASVTAQSITT